MMTWQPACYDPNLPTLSSISKYIKTEDTFIKNVAAGTYDSYVVSVASQIKSFLSGPDGVYGTSDDRRIYIRLAHEMNG